MAISWYPGHMHKASKELVKLMHKIHVVIEVLDARTPIASSNPLLAKIRQQTPVIKILNKTDLADPATTVAWKQYFESEGIGICLENGLDQQLTAKQVVDTATKLLKNVANTPTNRQFVILGIPNVGKSTLLNQLAKRNVANTGNEPAVTKRQQRIRLDDNSYLIDTPGMLWPKLEDQAAAYRLACTGTIRNTAVEMEDIAWAAAEILLKDHRQVLQERYKLPSSVTETEQVIEHIASVRGCITKGGRPDWHKTSEILLNDFRSGKLGRISLETPSMYQDEDPSAP